MVGVSEEHARFVVGLPCHAMSNTQRCSAHLSTTWMHLQAVWYDVSWFLNALISECFVVVVVFRRARRQSPRRWAPTSRMRHCWCWTAPQVRGASSTSHTYTWRSPALGYQPASHTGLPGDLHRASSSNLAASTWYICLILQLCPRSLVWTLGLVRFSVDALQA